MQAGDAVMWNAKNEQHSYSAHEAQDMEDDGTESDSGFAGPASKEANYKSKPRRKASQRPVGSDQKRQAFSKRKRGLVLKAYQLYKLTDAKVFLFMVNDKGSSWAYASPGFGATLTPAHLSQLRSQVKLAPSIRNSTEVMGHPKADEADKHIDDRNQFMSKLEVNNDSGDEHVPEAAAQPQQIKEIKAPTRGIPPGPHVALQERDRQMRQQEGSGEAQYYRMQSLAPSASVSPSNRVAAAAAALVAVRQQHQQQLAAAQRQAHPPQETPDAGGANANSSSHQGSLVSVSHEGAGEEEHSTAAGEIPTPSGKAIAEALGISCPKETQRETENLQSSYDTLPSPQHQEQAPARHAVAKLLADQSSKRSRDKDKANKHREKERRKDDNKPTGRVYATPAVSGAEGALGRAPGSTSGVRLAKPQAVERSANGVCSAVDAQGHVYQVVQDTPQQAALLESMQLQMQQHIQQQVRQQLQQQQQMQGMSQMQMVLVQLEDGRQAMVQVPMPVYPNYNQLVQSRPQFVLVPGMDAAAHLAAAAAASPFAGALAGQVPAAAAALLSGRARQ